MRILSHLLLILAAVIAGCAIVVFVALTNVACGYSPRSSGCLGRFWDLGSGDNPLLVDLPTAIVAGLIALAVVLRLKSQRSGDRRDGQ